MKPIYMLAVVILLCFAVLAAAGTMFLYDTSGEADTSEERSTEELAAELDKSLGVAPPAEKETEENKAADTATSAEESKDAAETVEEKTKEQDAASEEKKNTTNTSAPSNEGAGQTIKSNAISLGPEDESISVDKLLQMINE